MSVRVVYLTCRSMPNVIILSGNQGECIRYNIINGDGFQYCIMLVAGKYPDMLNDIPYPVDISKDRFCFSAWYILP